MIRRFLNWLCGTETPTKKDYLIKAMSGEVPDDCVFGAGINLIYDSTKLNKLRETWHLAVRDSSGRVPFEKAKPGAK